MKKLNDHVDKFLEYYCNLESPEYAVMLKGKWGSGKTFYINKFKKTLEKIEKEYVYVSLYGVSSYEEIEDKFFEQLHPSLHNKKMILGGNIFKDFLKGALKIDADRDLQVKDNTQIPEIKFPKYLTDTENHILIFDDLERCSIPINDILGYINHLVEHQSYKVIIVANEDELKKDEKEYQVIKEKLIGKIFELKSNVNSAFSNFIKNIDNKKVFNEHSELIKEIYLASGYDNLRFLRQTIYDFARLYSFVLFEHKDKPELIKDLLKLYFILSFENRKSDFDISRIDLYHSEYVKLTHSMKDKYKSNETKYKKLVNKYRFDFYYSKVFEVRTWNNILNKSIIDAIEINTAIVSSKYYSDVYTPSWKMLWNYRNLDDNEFERLIEVVEDELRNNKLENILIVMHASSMFTYMHTLGLYKPNKEDIHLWSKQHIDYLFKNKKVNKAFFENSNLLINQTGYNGLGFLGRDDEYFKMLLEYIQTKITQGEKETFTDYAKELVELIGVDDDKVYIKLLQTHTKESTFYNKPILSLMDVDALAIKLASVNNESQRNFGFILEDRYKSEIYNKKLVSEMDFLLELKDKLLLQQNILNGKLSGYNLKLFIDSSLNVAIQNLQNYIDKN